MKRSLMLVLLLSVLMQCFAAPIHANAAPASPQVPEFSIIAGATMVGGVNLLDLSVPANRTVKLNATLETGTFSISWLVLLGIQIPDEASITSISGTNEEGNTVSLGVDDWESSTVEFKSLTITCTIPASLEDGTYLYFEFGSSDKGFYTGTTVIRYSDSLLAGDAVRKVENPSGSGNHGVYYANESFTVKLIIDSILRFNEIKYEILDAADDSLVYTNSEPLPDPMTSCMSHFEVLLEDSGSSEYEPGNLYKVNCSATITEYVNASFLVHTFYIAYDVTAPASSLTYDEETSTLTCSAEDTFPGIAAYCLSRSETPGEWTAWDGVAPIVKKNVGGVWYFHVKDKCGNISTKSYDCGGWVIRVLTDGNGAADPDKPQIVPDGELFRLTLIPMNGYVLDTLTLNGPDHKRAVVLNADGTYSYNFLALVDTKVVASFCPAPSLDNLNPAYRDRLTEGDNPSDVERIYCYGVFDETVTAQSVATLGDAVKAACVLRELYYGNVPAFTPDSANPMNVYIKYARAHAIYLDADFKDTDFTSPVTLDQVAYLLSNILMKDTLQARASAPATVECGYPDAAIAMIQAGILPAEADFAANVSMGDLAAILLRAIEPANRL